MPPAVIGGTIAGIGALGAAGIQAGAAERAGETQSEAAEKAIEFQREMYQQQRADIAPWRRAGERALGTLEAGMAPGGRFTQEFGISPEEQFARSTRPYEIDPYQQFQELTRPPSELPGIPATYEALTQPFEFDPTQDPGYQWRSQQGREALEASAAARGGYFSGQTGQELMRFGQGLASEEYQRSFARDLARRQFQAGQYQRALGSELAQREFQARQYRGATDVELARRGFEAGEYRGMAGMDLAQRQALYNMYAGMAGTGQTAATQAGAWGGQAAGRIGDLYTQAGAAQAAGDVGQAQAWAGGLRDVGGQITGTIGAQMQYDMMQKALGMDEGG